MRAVVVADHPLAARAIERELRHTSGFAVIGCIDGRKSCADAVTPADPDVIVIDEMASHGALIARIAELRSAAPRAKLLLLSARMDRPLLANAVAAGIDAAVMKTAYFGRLGALLRDVAWGNVFHSFTSASSSNAAAEFGLTAREREVLGLVAAGLTNARIAARLWVSEPTVKYHLSNVFRKLGVANRTEASYRAHLYNLLDPGAASSVPVAPVPLAA
jgi:DNA-binding NarL/FixJ family response regulator